MLRQLWRGPRRSARRQGRRQDRQAAGPRPRRGRRRAAPGVGPCRQKGLDLHLPTRDETRLGHELQVVRCLHEITGADRLEYQFGLDLFLLQVSFELRLRLLVFEIGIA